MNKPDAGEIILRCGSDVVEAIQEYGRLMFEYALYLAAEKAEVYYLTDELGIDPATITVSKESILKLKELCK